MTAYYHARDDLVGGCINQCSCGFFFSYSLFSLALNFLLCLSYSSLTFLILKILKLISKQSIFSKQTSEKKDCTLIPSLFLIFMNMTARWVTVLFRVFFLVSLGLIFCFVPVMYFCWLYRTMTSSTYWCGVTPSVWDLDLDLQKAVENGQMEIMPCWVYCTLRNKTYINS